MALQYEVSQSVIPYFMHLPVAIRAATPADIDVLLRFQQGVVEAERSFDSTLRFGELHYYDVPALLVEPSVHMVVAEYSGRVVASGYARIEAAKPYLRHSHHDYLGFMYVEPAHRGRGINAQVVEALKQWAVLHKITELRLDVYAGNEGARRAYEKFGFRPHMLEMRMGT